MGTASNWSGGVVPSTNDTVNIGSGSDTILIVANTTIYKLTISGRTINIGSYELEVTHTATLTGGKIYNGKKAARGDFRDNIETETARNRWTPNNTNTGIPRANLNELPASNYFLEKGDFFRINNLTLGYTLAANTLGRFKMQSLRVYATAQNLATFTKYKGLDPELTNQYGLPLQREMVVGLTIGL